jgi:hypothetical protein
MSLYLAGRLPSYDDPCGSTERPIDYPPTYKEASDTKPRGLHGLPTLILVDGRHIYAECQTRLPLYSLSQPAVNKHAEYSVSYEITKHVYHLSKHDGQGVLMPKTARLYDISFDMRCAFGRVGGSPLAMLDGGIDIVGDVTAPGNSAARIVFPEEPPLIPNLLVMGCTVRTGFKTLFIVRYRRFMSGTNYVVEWKDNTGKLLAVETMPHRAKYGAVPTPGDGCADGWKGLPRLEIKAPMMARQFDFLVTCWMARFRRIETIYNA